MPRSARGKTLARVPAQPDLGAPGANLPVLWRLLIRIQSPVQIRLRLQVLRALQVLPALYVVPPLPVLRPLRRYRLQRGD